MMPTESPRWQRYVFTKGVWLMPIFIILAILIDRNLLSEQTRLMSKGFIKSIDATGDEDIIPRLMKACEAYMSNYSDATAVSGPNFGYYIRFLCFRDIENNAVIYTINPRVTAFLPQSGTEFIVEHSSLCFDWNQNNQKIERFKSISVSYWDLHQKQTIEANLEDIEAISFQHHVAVLNGYFPCTPKKWWQIHAYINEIVL